MLGGRVVGEEKPQQHKEVPRWEEVDTTLFQKSPKTLSHPPLPPRQRQSLQSGNSRGCPFFTYFCYVTVSVFLDHNFNRMVRPILPGSYLNEE